MASNVEIANRALQFLGADRIVDLAQNSKQARAANFAFETVRKSVLRSHPWNCAITRAQLAEDATAPLFGRETAFTLPVDCLRPLHPDPDLNFNDLDWQIEGRKLITNDSAPLDFRYIKDLSDPNDMDPLLREAVSMKLAFELAEELTQSNSKKEAAWTAYKEAIAEARRANAFENVAGKPPEDEWVTVRNQ